MILRPVLLFAGTADVAVPGPTPRGICPPCHADYGGEPRHPKAPSLHRDVCAPLPEVTDERLLSPATVSLRHKSARKLRVELRCVVGCSPPQSQHPYAAQSVRDGQGRPHAGLGCPGPVVAALHDHFPGLAPAGLEARRGDSSERRDGAARRCGERARGGRDGR